MANEQVEEMEFADSGQLGDTTPDKICIIHSPTASQENFTFLKSVKDPDKRFADLKELCSKRQGQPIGSAYRLDDMCASMPDKILDNHGYHRDCYKIFTRHTEKLREVITDEPSTSRSPRLKRTSDGVKDKVLFTPDCIFCNTDRRINVMSKGVRTTEGTSMFEMEGGEFVKNIAKQKGDRKLLCRIEHVDLFAVEARYHKTCRNEYTRSTLIGRSLDPEQISRQSDLEKAHEKAFNDVCSKVEQLVITDQNIVTLVDLNATYIESLNNTPFPNPGHRAEKLRKRLEKDEIGGRISFIGLQKPRLTLIYSKSIDVDTAIKMAYKLGATGNLTELAKTLRKTIVDAFENSTNLPWPPTTEYLQSIDGLVPDVLQSFLTCVLSNNPDTDTCSSRVNRLALSIGQDICRGVTKGQWKLPKHILLCLTFRHLFRSKQLTTLLNRFGHSESYVFGLELETAIANSVMQSSSVLTNQIVTNPAQQYIFHSEFDNFDKLVNELSGSGSVHTAHGIMLQEVKDIVDQPPDNPPVKRTGERSLSIEIDESLPECFMTTRKSPTMKIKRGYYDVGKSVYDKAYKQNLFWMLLRMHSRSFPGWSGFVSLNGNTPERLTTIGYYPVIYHPITDYKTVQECLRVSDEASKSVGQEYVVTTFDLGVCMKAYPIIWNNPAKYSKHIIMIGTFHLTCAYMHMIGKKMEGSGFTDILLEARMIGEGSIHGVLNGHNYSRAMLCHKVLLEALERLLFTSFLKQKDECDVFSSLPEPIKEKIRTSTDTLDIKGLCSMLEDHDSPISEYIVQYEAFKVKVREGYIGKTAQFWLSYMDHFWIVLQLHEAVKQNDFHLYAQCIHMMAGLFFSFSGQNYARYTTMFGVFLANIDESHPGASDILKKGAFSVARSMIPGCRCDVDKTMEETFMRHAKSNFGSSGVGLTGITRNYGAYQRWVATAHERSKYMDITLSMADMSRVSDSVDTHKDMKKCEIKKGQIKVKRTVEAIQNFVNPFETDMDKLYVVSSGNPVSADVEKDVLNAEICGIEARDTFIKERLQKNDNFFDPIKRMNLKTMEEMNKKVKVSTTKNKIVEYKQQTNIVTKLLVKSNELDMKLDFGELMTYCLTPIPYCIGTGDGFLAKTDKAKSFAFLTKTIPDETLPTSDMITVEDGNATFYYIREVPPTFQMISSKMYSLVSKGDVIFSTDSYSVSSVKALERKRRGTGEKLLLVGSSTRKPKDWKKFLYNDDNKRQLIEILHKEWTNLNAINQEDRLFVFVKEGKAFNLKEDVIIPELTSNQEETDSRIVLYCMYAANRGYKIIRVKSPDSDVFWIVLHHSFKINSEVLFETGHGNKKRLISITKIAKNYGESLCSAFLGLHGFSGCDSVSAFKGKGKVTPINLVIKSAQHSSVLQQLGTSWIVTDELMNGVERLTCAMYGKPKYQKVDELRAFLLKSKCKDKDMQITGKTNIDLSTMPPSQACLREHTKRANYQVRIWRLADTPLFEIPKPFDDHGWMESGEPLWCTADKIIPPSLADLLDNVSADNTDDVDEDYTQDSDTDETEDDDDD